MSDEAERELRPYEVEREATRAEFRDWREGQGIAAAEREPRPEHIVSRKDLKNDRGTPLCGSVTRSPGKHGDWLCHQIGMRSNGRCKMHGGNNRALIQVEGLGVTKRSKLLDDLHLTEQFKAYREDPELAELQRELALCDIMIDQALKASHKRKATEAERKEYRDVINLKRKLVDSVHKNNKAVIPIQRVMAFLHAQTNIWMKYVKDPRDRAQALLDIRNLSGRPAALEDEPINVTPQKQAAES